MRQPNEWIFTEEAHTWMDDRFTLRSQAGYIDGGFFQFRELGCSRCDNCFDEPVMHYKDDYEPGMIFL